MSFWSFWKRTTNKENALRKIITLRGKKNIEKAIEKEAHLIFRKVEPFSTISGKFCIVRNKTTGIKFRIYDFRDNRRWSDKYEIITDWTYIYDDYNFPEEAAYVIPKDIKVGEIVFVDDLIENFHGYMHNQGDSRRLKGCKAIWNNNDLQILYNPKVDCIQVVG